MDLDDLAAPGASDPLALVLREDLDRYSVEELTARIGKLEQEIARCRRRIDVAVNHRASAETLFKR